MFQKLYRHLEEINNSLREDRMGGANQMGQAIIDQLERVNSTLDRVQRQLNAERNASVTPVVSSARPMWTTILWVIVVAAVVPTLIFMSLTLSQINTGLAAQALHSSIVPSGAIPTANLDNTVAVEPAGVAESRMAVQRHLATLDSLIAEQEQAVAELKKLNATAVSTMRSIRRHFVVTERLGRTGLSMRIDSAMTAR
jgi:hypothetical protein